MKCVFHPDFPLCAKHGHFTGEYCAECADRAIEDFGDRPLNPNLPCNEAYTEFLRECGVTFA